MPRPFESKRFAFFSILCHLQSDLGGGFIHPPPIPPLPQQKLGVLHMEIAQSFHTACNEYF